MQYKDGRIILPINEFSVSGNTYNLNGINLTYAVFFVREEKKKFRLLLPGEYQIKTVGSNVNLEIQSSVLTNKIAVQVGYDYTRISSEYSVFGTPDIAILKDEYNKLAKDVNNLWEYIKKQGVTSDVLNSDIVIPKLKQGETIVFKDGNLEAIVLYDAIEELKRSVEIVRREINDELDAKMNAFSIRIDGLLNSFRLEIENKINVGKNEITNLVNNSKTEINTLVNDSKTGISVLVDSQRTSLIELTDTSKNDINSLVVNQKNSITTLVDNSKTDINNTANTQITSITNVVNSSRTGISALANNEKTDISDLAEDKKDEIRNLATTIIGFDPADCLLKGGTKYNDAVEIERDIDDLKKKEGGDIVRVKFSISTYTPGGGGGSHRYLKISDLNGVEITEFKKAKKYIGEINTTDTSAIERGTVTLKDDTQTYDVYRSGMYNGGFIENVINYSDFQQYSIQELYWSDFMNNGSGSWALKNSNLPFNLYAPGLFTARAYGELRTEKGGVNMHFGAYTDSKIIDELNKVFLDGKDAQVDMFMSASAFTPTLSCDNSGSMIFEQHSDSVMRLIFTPKTVDGYSVTSAECRVPMKFDHTINKAVMDNTFSLRTLGNWRFFGTKQKLFQGVLAKTMTSAIQTQTLNASDFSNTWAVWCFRKLIIYGNVQVSRMTSSATFPFKAYIETNSYNTETPIATYITKNGSWEQVNIVGNIEGTTTISSLLSMTFSIKNRNGTLDTGNCTVQVTRIDAEFY